MILIDTSIWIMIFKDTQGTETQRIQDWLDGREVVLTRFNQLELLQGARDDREWALLFEYLYDQTYVDATPDTWQAAARIYFDLRRQGQTVRSPIDCCIAQLAIDNELVLLHHDKDFNVISQIRPLTHHHWIDDTHQ